LSSTATSKAIKAVKVRLPYIREALSLYIDSVSLIALPEDLNTLQDIESELRDLQEIVNQVEQTAT
jgi:hypothetical protein